MNVKLLRVTPFGDDLAGQAAAICTRSENQDKARDFAIASGHESVLEHIVFTFEVSEISRVTLAQLTRHRIASFEVESQRSVKSSTCSIVEPETISGDKELNQKFLNLVRLTREFLDEAEKKGIPREDARYAAMEGTCTHLIMTMNARELRHFVSLRSCNRAQWEIRRMSDKILAICKEECPAIFANAGPGCVRRRCPEKRPCGKPRTHDWEDE